MPDTDLMVAKESPSSIHALCIVNSVAVCYHGVSSTMAKPTQTRCMNTVAEAATAVVYSEKVLNTTNAAELSHKSLEVVTALKVLVQATKSMCSVSDKLFRNLHDAHELLGKEALTQSDYMQLCCLLYNVRRQKDFQNSDLVLFIAKVLETFCEFAKEVLKCVGYEHICYFTKQFPYWWWPSRNCTKEV